MSPPNRYLHIWKSHAKEPYKIDDILPKWPIIWTGTCTYERVMSRVWKSHATSIEVLILKRDLYDSSIRATWLFGTGWRRLVGCLKLQVIFRKRATNYRALLRKITYAENPSYHSTPPCRRDVTLFASHVICKIILQMTSLFDIILLDVIFLCNAKWHHAKWCQIIMSFAKCILQNKIANKDVILQNDILQNDKCHLLNDMMQHDMMQHDMRGGYD